MDSKLERLLNHIGINEDYIKYFKNSYVEKVVVDKNENTFNFIVNIDSIPHIDVYNDVLECLNKEFSNKARLEFNCSKDNYNNVKEYLNKIIEDYAKESI